MGWAIVRNSDGYVMCWSRHDRLASLGYDPQAFTEIAHDEFPDKNAVRWNGSAFITLSQSEIDANELTARRASAVATFNDAQAEAALRDRAIVLVSKDEINLLRSWITDFKAAVAGAGSLAALKTAVAALPNMPARTKDQAKAAIENKINDDESN